MMKKLRLALGSAIILVAFGLPYAQEMVAPQEPSVREVLAIEKPAEKYLEKSRKNDSVDDKKDRESLSIFNYEFARRALGYDTTVQKIQDVYTMAGKTVYGDSMLKKYPNLSDLMGSKALIEIFGEHDGFAKKEQLMELKKQYSSNAWVLGDDSE